MKRALVGAALLGALGGGLALNRALATQPTILVPSSCVRIGGEHPLPCPK